MHQLKHVRALWRKRVNVRRARNSSPCRYAKHVDLKKPITVEVLQEQIAGMVNKELLTFEQAEEIAIEK